MPTYQSAGLPSYQVVSHTTGLTVGETVTEEQLTKDHAALGGVERLLKLGAIRPAEAPKVEKAGDVKKVEPKAADAKKSEPDAKGKNG
jgi:hypothetical protein